MPRNKLILAAIMITIFIVIILAGPEKYLNLDFVKSSLNSILDYKDANPVKSIFIFSAIYVGITAVSIPGALILTLSSGAIFGFTTGTLIAIFSSTIGATLAFLVSRYLFHDLVAEHWSGRLARIRESFHREGALYLFSMRLVPVFPFFLINLLMGLTPIRVKSFIIATLCGMVPASIVFVNTGTQLARLDSLKGILSPAIIGSLLLLAIFPWVAKAIVSVIRRGRKQNEKAV